jgi:hypothetical protein
MSVFLFDIMLTLAGRVSELNTTKYVTNATIMSEYVAETQQFYLSRRRCVNSTKEGFLHIQVPWRPSGQYLVLYVLSTTKQNML